MTSTASAQKNMTFEVQAGMNVVVRGPNGVRQPPASGDEFGSFGGKLTQACAPRVSYVPQPGYQGLSKRLPAGDLLVAAHQASGLFKARREHQHHSFLLLFVPRPLTSYDYFLNFVCLLSLVHRYLILWHAQHHDLPRWWSRCGPWV
jgi:hypothetical protein